MDVLLDPYPFYTRLREAAPVTFIEKYGSYAVGRYDAVRAVLADWESFTSAAGIGLTDIRKPDAWRQPGPLVEADPPEHTHIRDVVTRIISPKVMRGWKAFFEREASLMAGQLSDQREVNGAEDIAEAYVMKVFPESLGLKPHRENMMIVGNYNFNALGPKNDLFFQSERELAEIADWYETAQDRDGVEPGSFAEKIFLAEDAGDLEPGQGRGLVRTFLRGGMDTTISGISSSLMFLAHIPGLWKRLREDRSRVKFLLEETIRVEAPIQTFFRTTTKPVEIGGIKLKPDTKIQVFIGSANRDPSQWERADEFDIDRRQGAHLAFGHGVHNCIGQMIARMEAECLFTALLDRFASVEPIGEPVYRPRNIGRTLKSLPLRFNPA